MHWVLLSIGYKLFDYWLLYYYDLNYIALMESPALLFDFTTQLLDPPELLTERS